MLCSSLYFRSEHPGLRAESYQQLWKHLGVLGNRIGDVYTVETVTVTTPDQVQIQLGDVESFRVALPEENGFIEGGIAVDEDIVVCSHREAPWRNGHALGRSLLNFSHEAINSASWEVVLELLHHHVRLADDSGAFYGLIDFADERETIHGGTYGSVVHLDAPLRSIAEQSIWLQQGAKQNRVRSVYWGNYLSNELLEELSDNFIEDYRKEAQTLNGDATGLIWEFPRGVFLSISLDPTVGSIFGEDMIHFDTLQNLNWLVEQFTEARLL